MDSTVLTEFNSLCNKRDMEAYYVVGAVQAVVGFFEAQSFDEAEKGLRRALARYEEADRAITAFRNQHFPPAPAEKENQNGNQHAAA